MESEGEGKRKDENARLSSRLLEEEDQVRRDLGLVRKEVLLDAAKDKNQTKRSQVESNEERRGAKERETRRSHSPKNKLSNDRTSEHVHLRQQSLSESQLGRVDVIDGLPERKTKMKTKKNESQLRLEKLQKANAFRSESSPVHRPST